MFSIQTYPARHPEVTSLVVSHITSCILTTTDIDSDHRHLMKRNPPVPPRRTRRLARNGRRTRRQVQRGPGRRSVADRRRWKRQRAPRPPLRAGRRAHGARSRRARGAVRAPADRRVPRHPLPPQGRLAARQGRRDRPRHGRHRPHAAHSVGTAAHARRGSGREVPALAAACPGPRPTSRRPCVNTRRASASQPWRRRPTPPSERPCSRR